MSYILYKNPTEYSTLHVVQYLHYSGFKNILPKSCIERKYPTPVTELPSIHDLEADEWFIGLGRCVEFYGRFTPDKERLLERSEEFRRDHPNYRINGSPR